MNYINKYEKEKHEFALYVPLLSSLVETIVPGEDIIISDEKIVQRMSSILRLSPQEQCIFFDKNIHIKCVIKEFIGKKQIKCIVQEKRINTILSPNITFLLPVLKRDDFENALYSLTEIGVTTIQLVLTKKSHNISLNQKDMERAQRIIIAAAEQSKNFAYPELKAPVSLLKIVDTLMIPTKIFFNQQGNSFLSIIQHLLIECPNDIVLLVGPEGDLSNEEKEVIKSKKFIVCTLTPTVLRSVQAVSLGAGLIRSLLFK